MSPQRGFTSAFLWHLLAWILGLLAFFVFYVLAFPFLFNGFRIGLLIVGVGVIVAVAMYALLVRRFFARRIGVVLSRGEALATVVVAILLAAAIAMVLDAVVAGAGTVVALFVPMFAVPYWLLRRKTIAQADAPDVAAQRPESD
jgi:hypothetical protein